MYSKVQTAALCRRELHILSVYEVECAERLLMEGINYEFMCHHPALHTLASNLSVFLSKSSPEDREPHASLGTRSHKTADYSVEYSHELQERALEIFQRALVFSDIQFLCAPAPAAYAILAVVLGSVDKSECVMGGAMRRFVHASLQDHSSDCVQDFVRQVNAAIQVLVHCPMMNIKSSRKRSKRIVEERAENLRHVLSKAANIRLLREMCGQPSLYESRKRARLEQEFTPPRHGLRRRLARVTPLTGQY